MNKKHFKNIINGYSNAPINQLFKPKMKLSLGQCEIEMKISKNFHHSANSLHGSIYFKMLDDAAWGASNTYIDDVFLFTYNFNIYLTKPVSSGIIISKGKVIDKKDGKIKGESQTEFGEYYTAMSLEEKYLTEDIFNDYKLYDNE